jgi:hypothetical protein
MGLGYGVWGMGLVCGVWGMGYGVWVSVSVCVCVKVRLCMYVYVVVIKTHTHLSHTYNIPKRRFAPAVFWTFFNTTVMTLFMSSFRFLAWKAMASLRLMLDTTSPDMRMKGSERMMFIASKVYGCGCVGVWVYGCMGVWVYGCMGVWVYGCMGGGRGIVGGGGEV